MAQASANGIQIEYESFGPADRETVLLIMGHGAQLTRWPVELCEELVRRGYRVIRYDNRDVGLSTKFEAAGVPDMAAVGAAIAAGRPPPIPYTLDDMARDAVGLLDALGVPAAHIVGASLGGMVAQLVAADHPEHTRSLTSIMCTASNPQIPIITPAAAELFGRLFGAGMGETEDAFVDRYLEMERWMMSPAYPTPLETVRARIVADYRRNFCPEGSARHGAASGTAPDRRAKLRTVRAPTVVMHGEKDPGVPLEGAYDVAGCIPGAELRIIPGMGHDVPVALAPVFADAITAAAARAEAPRASA